MRPKFKESVEGFLEELVGLLVVCVFWQGLSGLGEVHCGRLRCDQIPGEGVEGFLKELVRHSPAET